MVKDFQQIVGSQVPENVLFEILKKCQWDVNSAADMFFIHGYADKYAS